jgi:hypothetical protein
LTGSQWLAGYWGQFRLTSKDALRSRREDLLKKTADDINELFVPHQVKRLRQTCRQMMFDARDFDFGLTGKSLSNSLEIDPQQVEKIKHQAVEHQKEIDERVNKLEAELTELRSEAKEQLFAVLTEEQRRRYEQFFGDIHFKKKQTQKK